MRQTYMRIQISVSSSDVGKVADDKDNISRNGTAVATSPSKMLPCRGRFDEGAGIILN